MKAGSFLCWAVSLAVPVALGASVSWTGPDEREERADETEPLARLLHDVWTQINDLIGMAGLLLDGNLSVEQREQAMTIQSSGRALLEIINVLDSSTLEPGRLSAGRPAPRPLHADARVDLTPPTRQRRVLVVDHIPANQLVLQRMVEREGYAVETASSGAEALAALERGLFDIVLMGCAMPEMDGLETTRRIRERFAKRPKVPIIAVTADALEHDREACRAAGMDDYLEQPLDRGTLGEMLTLWLEGERETRAA